jgi:hypothetical protein
MLLGLLLALRQAWRAQRHSSASPAMTATAPDTAA